MIEVCGRKVKVRTGTRSQTVNICDEKNIHGVYGYIVRLRAPFLSEETLASQAFQSTDELVQYLEREHCGTVERTPKQNKQEHRKNGADQRFTVQSIGGRKSKLQIGVTLTRRRKENPNAPPYEWAVPRDIIYAPPTNDGTIYFAALCEGLNEHGGEWFVYRSYYTPTRNGNLGYGQYGPQAPFTIDKWIAEQILERKWHQGRREQ